MLGESSPLLPVTEQHSRARQRTHSGSAAYAQRSTQRTRPKEDFGRQHVLVPRLALRACRGGARQVSEEPPRVRSELKRQQVQLSPAPSGLPP